MSQNNDFRSVAMQLGCCWKPNFIDIQEASVENLLFKYQGAIRVMSLSVNKELILSDENIQHI
jgi:hypothetical protein